MLDLYRAYWDINKTPYVKLMQEESNRSYNSMKRRHQKQEFMDSIDIGKRILRQHNKYIVNLATSHIKIGSKLSITCYL